MVLDFENVKNQMKELETKLKRNEDENQDCCKHLTDEIKDLKQQSQAEKMLLARYVSEIQDLKEKNEMMAKWIQMLTNE